MLYKSNNKTHKREINELNIYITIPPPPEKNTTFLHFILPKWNWIAELSANPLKTINTHAIPSL